MREHWDLDRERTGYGYSVENETISRLIDGLLQELRPYSNHDLIREIVVTAVKLAQEGSDRGDLKIIRTTIKELRYAFKVFSHYRDRPKITVFGSARTSPEAPAYKSALDFARTMAEAGYMVITGAGPGIMAAGHEGAGLDNSIGLNIRLPFEQAPNDTIIGDEKLINFRYFFTRKLFFVKESYALVLMPGGFGTHDEGFETLTLIQTGKSAMKPVVMLDEPGGGYWKQWLGFVEDQILGRGYISPEDMSLFYVTDSVEAACNEIRHFYRIYHSARYVEHRAKLVLRLNQPVGQQVVDVLNQLFADILVRGRIAQGDAFPEERDEPGLLNLKRLIIPFDQRQFGRLRQLIDTVNKLG